MTSPSPQHVSSQTLKLLQAYQEAPSSQLQEQLLQLNIGLVHQAIALLVDGDRQDDSHLLTSGIAGLAIALSEFNFQSQLSFEDFAKDCIHTHIQAYLHHHAATDLATAAPVAPAQSFERKPPAKKTKPAKLQSFRLSVDDTRLLQDAISTLERRTLEKRAAVAIDDSPSGPLKAETIMLLEEYRRQPTPKLMNRLVQLNIGLVRKEAYHWSNQCLESLEDLMQVGSMGLIRALDRFDLQRGHAFSSFAVPYIRGEIQHYLRDKSPAVRIPRRWLVAYNQGCKASRQLRQSLHREPSDKEIAYVMGITVAEWQDIKLACQNRSPLSLDAPIHDDENGTSSLGDLMPDRRYHSFQLAQEDSLRLYQALSHLEDRTREIVEFVFLKEFTHREVAEILGISAVTVSRQVKKGLTTLKEIMTAPIE